MFIHDSIFMLVHIWNYTNLCSLWAYIVLMHKPALRFDPINKVAIGAGASLVSRYADTVVLVLLAHVLFSFVVLKAFEKIKSNNWANKTGYHQRLFSISLLKFSSLIICFGGFHQIIQDDYRNFILQCFVSPGQHSTTQNDSVYYPRGQRKPENILFESLAS